MKPAGYATMVRRDGLPPNNSPLNPHFSFLATLKFDLELDSEAIVFGCVLIGYGIHHPSFSLDHLLSYLKPTDHIR